MAVLLEWNGQIGWDLWSQSVRDSLKESGSEDIDVRFSSIGGDIFEGADIFSMLSDHKIDHPGVKMNLEIKGVAASMGSFIASSPVWDTVSVEDITGYMIHNPYTISLGDYREMESKAEFLSRATAAYAKAYSSRSGKPIEEIRDMMDKTTWLFGQDIVDSGFADTVVKTSESVDKSTMLMRYQSQFTKMKARQKEISGADGFDLNKAAACFRPEMAVTSYKSNAKLIDTPWSASESESRWRDHVGVESREDLPKASYTKRFAWYDSTDSEKFGAYKFPHWDYNESDGEFVNIPAVRNGLARLSQSDVPEVEQPRVESLLRRYLDRFNEQNSNGSYAGNGDGNTPGDPGKPSREASMNEEELKEKYPDLYEAVMKKGADGFKSGNDERIKVLVEMKGKDEYKDIPEVVAVIDKAIEDGTDSNAVQPLIMAAMMKIYRDPTRMQQLEGPGNISGYGNGGGHVPGQMITEV